MCGICGIVGGDPAREAPRVEAMLRALAHRGPDDQGVHTSEGAVLGHRRLTIIDLDRGRQPLSNEDGTLWITFNGEIYNYRELRNDLVARGHVFRTHTDTEVLLHLFEEEGPDCLHRLRGMFAFAIWNTRDRSLFAARDHFGQKPFFYAEAGDRLLFASEIKGVLAHGAIDAAPEPAAIHHYLGLRFVPPPLTMIRGVSKLGPGQRLFWRDGRLDVETWWRWTFPGDDARPRRSEAEWVAELEAAVDDAVASHMVSDVPVGAFLSGGIDSSLVVEAMTRLTGESAPTFAIGSDVASFDETPFAREVADHCGTTHLEGRVGVAQLQAIPRLVRSLDEPSDPIAACMYEASRLAARHVKVVLGGDGGDELFAGFDRYLGFGWLDYYAALPRAVREGIVRPLVRRLPESFAYKSVTQRLRWLDALGGERGGHRYARMTSFFRFGPEEREWTYGPVLARATASVDAEEAIARPFREAPAEEALHRMLFADSVTRLPEHTLMLTDRLSMAHGLETRAPLLDPCLAELAASMPPELKIRGRTTKYAARKVAERRLPASIVQRKKQGFMFPVAYWLNADTLPGISRGLLDGPLVAGGWVQETAIHRLAREHAEKRQDHHVRIWMLMNLDAWMRIYMEGENVEDVSQVAPEAAPLCSPDSSGVA